MKDTAPWATLAISSSFGRRLGRDEPRTDNVSPSDTDEHRYTKTIGLTTTRQVAKAATHGAQGNKVLQTGPPVGS